MRVSAPLPSQVTVMTRRVRQPSGMWKGL